MDIWIKTLLYATINYHEQNMHSTLKIWTRTAWKLFNSFFYASLNWVPFLFLFQNHFSFFTIIDELIYPFKVLIAAHIVNQLSEYIFNPLSAALETFRLVYLCWPSGFCRNGAINMLMNPALYTCLVCMHGAYVKSNQQLLPFSGLPSNTHVCESLKSLTGSCWEKHTSSSMSANSLNAGGWVLGSK